MKRMITCECGAKYLEGSVRHISSKPHVKYLTDIENYNQKYTEVLVLLMTEKYKCDDRMEKSKKLLEKRMKGYDDKYARIKELKNEYLKVKHMTTQP